MRRIEGFLAAVAVGVAGIDVVAGRKMPSSDSPHLLEVVVDFGGHVNLGALNGATVKDIRKVMAFMAALDAAQELLGGD